MKYYALISGLPDITLEDLKSSYTVQSLKQELETILSFLDKKLTNSLFLKYDNDNILQYLRNKEAVLENKGTIPPEILIEAVQEIKIYEKTTIKIIPKYIKVFISDYLTGTDALYKLFWEDHLAGLYYDYLLKVPNKFIKDWANYNLNIFNILIAMACRKTDREYSPYIIGNNDIAHILRVSKARDFGISDFFEQLEDLRRIDEETDLLEKEIKIDQMRWNWIENQNIFNYFTLEQVIGYLLKIQMLERWLSLNDEKGKEIFNRIVMNLKELKTEK